MCVRSWQRALASIVLVLGCGSRQVEQPAGQARQPAPVITPVPTRPPPSPPAPDPIAVFAAGDLRLRAEALRDDIVHFELASTRVPLASSIQTSPMIARRDPAIPWTKRSGNVLETRELRVEVEPATLCAKVTDLARGFVLQRTCPDGAANALTITKETTQNVYGLGEQFVTAGSPDGDWIGRERTPGNSHGNAMVKFDGNKDDSGSVGNTQFPILYALSGGKQGYAMFVDDPYAEHWSFKGDPWTLRTIGDALRWYVIAGPDVPDLRRDYMGLVGHPPVPPKQAFGLWVSEYGFDNWKELEDKLRTLRKNKFPVDGFVLDLQWFGNIQEKSETSRMGSLTWDIKNFPEPEKKIKELADQGVALVLIEESYVSRGLPEHADLAKRGFLARDGEGGAATFISHNPWWGVGGMIDWTNKLGADYWHDTKRQPLVDAGILGHWCDLGEPEMYSDKSWYASGAGGGHRHIDIHNLFTLSWVDSIWRGYQRHKVERRPFVLARSGGPGIERYGVAMWSGDIVVGRHRLEPDDAGDAPQCADAHVDVGHRLLRLGHQRLHPRSRARKAERDVYAVVRGRRGRRCACSRAYAEPDEQARDRPRSRRSPAEQPRQPAPPLRARAVLVLARSSRIRERRSGVSAARVCVPG
jgi:alpha-glucosidase (family GH31 glycosyl hydrolase)